MMQHRKIQVAGNFIDGEFRIPSDADEILTSLNPANTKDAIGDFSVSYGDIDKGVSAARSAQEKWANLSLEERMALLRAYQHILRSRTLDLAELIAREVGKPLWEAEGEVKAMISKVDITIEESLPLVSPREVSNASGKKEGRYLFHPRGVAVVLGAFNFPGHLANGHFVPALLTGNTVVFKPSEITPAVGQCIAECFQEAGFPAGVFNLVQGGGEVGKRLVEHRDIDLILFTGSYETGEKIRTSTLDHCGKIAALEMGGKNAAIVCEDADFEKALFETLMGAYLTTGQRCTSTSRIVIARLLLDKFVSAFQSRAERLRIGYPFSPDVFMGPLVSDGAREKYLRFQGIAVRGGAEQILRGERYEAEYPGYYVTPSIDLVTRPNREDLYQTTEIFGPNVAIYPFDDIDEAISIANSSPYGLAMSVFTANEKIYEKVLQKGEAGVINWNTMTAGASSRLPFGGIKKSGNGFPTALFAVYYCTYPVASLVDQERVDYDTFPPGMRWEEGS